MIRGTAAKYVFAACLVASVVDLVIVDLFVGPMALGAEAGPPTATAPALIPTPSATPTPSETAPPAPKAAAVPTAPAEDLDAAPPSLSRGRSRVVARFDSDLPSANDEDLRALAAEMLADPTAEIVLEGHTDQRGDPVRNRALSLERATWAQNKLVELGVSPTRIAVVGLGAERPLYTAEDDAAVASNRRVELRWLSRSGSGSPSREERDR